FMAGKGLGMGSAIGEAFGPIAKYGPSVGLSALDTVAGGQKPWPFKGELPDTSKIRRAAQGIKVYTDKFSELTKRRGY
ncbi:MAG: hypothetical protein AAB801_02385, partial [Patescibacteria group bacterium]